MDPLTQALQAAGAPTAESHVLRTVNADQKMECPLAGRGFQEWSLIDRLERKSGKRNWRFGARLGEEDDGSMAQGAQSVEATPPAARKASVREITEFLKPKDRWAIRPQFLQTPSSGLL